MEEEKERRRREREGQSEGGMRWGHASKTTEMKLPQPAKKSYTVPASLQKVGIQNTRDNATPT